MRERFASLSSRERNLAILAGLSVAGFLVWMGVAAPRLQEMKVLGQQKEGLQTEIAELQARPGVIPGLSAVGPAAGGGAPLQGSLFGGFETLERLAERHRLDLVSVKMAPPEDQGSYTAYLAGIDLVGRYRNIVELLEALERLPGWIQVRGFRIEENLEAAPRVEAHLEAVILDEKKDGKP